MEKDNINVAFAFDYNFYRQAVVAISSLVNLNPEVGYDIYCIVKSDITPIIQEEIKIIIKGKSQQSNVFFIDTGNYFEKAYECRGITKATYYRLILHRLLDVDKIIYSDVDVIFKDDLTQINKKNIESFYLGAVKDCGINTKARRKELEKLYPYWKTDLANVGWNYYQAGFLLFNLKKFRLGNLDDKIIELSERNYNHQDQDIINILFSATPKSILNVGSKYAAIPGFNYQQALNEGIISQKDFDDIYNDPAIIHYAGIKPWDDRSICMADKWWDYMKQNTPYYSYFKKRYLKVLIKKNIKIFKKKLLSIEMKEKKGKKYKILYILGIKIKL